MLTEHYFSEHPSKVMQLPVSSRPKAHAWIPEIKVGALVALVQVILELAKHVVHIP
jgi:hypothetical protein